MSRSYKKTPSCGDHICKFFKRYASKTVRHAKDVPSGSAYKKFFDTWAIRDYFKCPVSYGDYLESEKRFKVWCPDHEINEKELRKEWKKRYVRK